MTMAHPLAPLDGKKNIERKQQQTDPQDEEKREKQHHIDQSMNTFFPRGNGNDLHNNQFIYELI